MLVIYIVLYLFVGILTAVLLGKRVNSYFIEDQVQCLIVILLWPVYCLATGLVLLLLLAEILESVDKRKQ